MKKLYPKILFIVSILLFSICAHSDEHDQIAQDQTNSQKQETTITTVQENTEDPIEIFTPTETISEDLSVPFPVDI
jgi:protein involved in sex pheromone biosynthesis